MQNKIAFLFFLLISAWQVGFSQEAPSTTKTTQDFYTVEPSFGGMTKGEIIISDYLEDSLSFTDGEARASHRINSFHLTILCDDVVMKYFENNAGSSLTGEMKQSLVKYHAGCTIVFDGIRIERISKEYKGRTYYTPTDPVLRFTMK